jgi:hypothetical protein
MKNKIIQVIVLGVVFFIINILFNLTTSCLCPINMTNTDFITDCKWDIVWGCQRTHNWSNF